MSLKPLTASTIRNKKSLVELYLSQHNESFILREISSIIEQTRSGVKAEERRFVKRISTREVLMFAYRHGWPDGYAANEEMRMKMDDVRAAMGVRNAKS